MSVEVMVACPCPGTPHPDGDTVSLRDKPSLVQGIRMQRFIVDAFTGSGAQAADAEALLGEAYLLYGVESWTLVDGNGSPVAVSEDAIRKHLLADFSTALPVAQKADELYAKVVIDPLVETVRKSLLSSPTGGSTSASPTTEPTPMKRSKRSSTTTTPTAGTETTSGLLAGASR